MVSDDHNAMISDNNQACDALSRLIMSRQSSLDTVSRQ